MVNDGEYKRPAGIGTGYLSVMMIFVVLCLTLLAALSYSSASNEKKYSDKSAEYTKEYYAADLEAKRTLAEIDGIAAGYDNYTDFMFLAELDEMENIGYTVLPDGVEISFLTAINDRQSISVTVRYKGGGYEITSRKTVSSSDEDSRPLNVWDGNTN